MAITAKELQACLATVTAAVLAIAPFPASAAPARSNAGMRVTQHDVTELMPATRAEAQAVCNDPQNVDAIFQQKMQGEALRRYLANCAGIVGSLLITTLKPERTHLFTLSQDPETRRYILNETVANVVVGNPRDGRETPTLRTAVWQVYHRPGYPNPPPGSQSSEMEAYMEPGLAVRFLDDLPKPRTIRGTNQVGLVFLHHGYNGLTTKDKMYTAPDGQRSISNGCIRTPKELLELIARTVQPARDTQDNPGTPVFILKGMASLETATPRVNRENQLSLDQILPDAAVAANPWLRDGALEFVSSERGQDIQLIVRVPNAILEELYATEREEQRTAFAVAAEQGGRG